MQASNSAHPFVSVSSVFSSARAEPLAFGANVNATMSNRGMTTGFTPGFSLPTHRYQIHPTAVFGILKFKPNDEALRFIRPYPKDDIANFMLGFSAYQGDRGLNALLNKHNIRNFFEEFELNSFVASALFPTKEVDFNHLNNPVVTDYTTGVFRSNPMLRDVHRKVLSVALEKFGMRRQGDKIGALKALYYRTELSPPDWLKPEGVNDRLLLMRMVKSLTLLGSHALAKKLAFVCQNLLNTWGLCTDAAFFQHAANIITAKMPWQKSAQAAKKPFQSAAPLIPPKAIPIPNIDKAKVDDKAKANIETTAKTPPSSKPADEKPAEPYPCMRFIDKPAQWKQAAEKPKPPPPTKEQPKTQPRQPFSQAKPQAEKHTSAKPREKKMPTEKPKPAAEHNLVYSKRDPKDYTEDGRIILPNGKAMAHPQIGVTQTLFDARGEQTILYGTEKGTEVTFRGITKFYPRAPGDQLQQPMQDYFSQGPFVNRGIDDFLSEVFASMGMNYQQYNNPDERAAFRHERQGRQAQKDKRKAEKRAEKAAKQRGRAEKVKPESQESIFITEGSTTVVSSQGHRIKATGTKEGVWITLEGKDEFYRKGKKIPPIYGKQFIYVSPAEYYRAQQQSQDDYWANQNDDAGFLFGSGFEAFASGIRFGGANPFSQHGQGYQRRPRYDNASSNNGYSPLTFKGKTLEQFCFQDLPEGPVTNEPLPRAFALKCLGLPNNASEDDIKKAFRSQVRDLHPDKHAGNESQFKKLLYAFKVAMGEQK